MLVEEATQNFVMIVDGFTLDNSDQVTIPEPIILKAVGPVNAVSTMMPCGNQTDGELELRIFTEALTAD